MKQPETLRPALVADARREFDSSFTVPAVISRKHVHLVVRIRVSDRIFAVKRDELTGISKLKQVLPIPSSASALLGITTVRGTLVPVFDLAAMLGLTSSREQAAWTLLINRATPVGLAFDDFEGQSEVFSGNFFDGDPPQAGSYFHQIAETDAGKLPVLDIAGLLESIRKNAGQSTPAQG